MTNLLPTVHRGLIFGAVTYMNIHVKNTKYKFITDFFKKVSLLAA